MLFSARGVIEYISNRRMYFFFTAFGFDFWSFIYNFDSGSILISYISHYESNSIQHNYYSERVNGNVKNTSSDSPTLEREEGPSPKRIPAWPTTLRVFDLQKSPTASNGTRNRRKIVSQTNLFLHRENCNQ